MKINYTCKRMVFLDLRLEQTLLYYDGHQIWISYTISGDRFLCIKINDSDYLAAIVSEQTITLIKTGMICTRSVIEQSPQVVLVKEGAGLCEIIIPTEEQLPAYGLFLDLK